MVDIFNTPVKTTINRSLQSKSIMVVGKSKSGKSTLAAQAPKPIFLCTENGVEGITGITPIAIASWPDFKAAVNQLCLPAAREKFNTVVIDTYTNLILLLDKYVGQKLTTEKNNLDFGSDADYGKGTKAMRNELGLQLQKLANQGYLLLNIVHAEDKTDFETGKDYIGTSLSNSLYGVAEKFVDQIIYLRRDENKKTHEIEHRIWFNSKGGFAGAGGRFTPTIESVPCEFTEMKKALLEAMDKRGVETGATIVTEEKPSVTIEVTENGDLDLEKLKDEFHAITKEMVEKSKDNVPVIQKIVANVLGPNKKADNLIPGQEELLLEIITELKASLT